MLGREYMKLGKHSMRRVAFWALAGVVALGATIHKGYAQGGGPPKMFRWFTSVETKISFLRHFRNHKRQNL